MEHWGIVYGQDLNVADNEVCDTKTGCQHRAMNLPGWPGDYDNPCSMCGDWKGCQNSNKVTPTIASLALAMEYVVTGRKADASSVECCLEEGGMPGEGHDPCWESVGYQASPDATAILQHYVGHYHGE